MTNEKLLAMWKQKLPNVEPTNQELTSFALGVEVGATAAGPSETHEAMCPALTGGRCTCERNDPTVDKAWARFCGGIGDGPDAPYPGMISAFERYYSQSFTDKDWRNEASVWAAAWKQALLTAAAPPTQPAPQQEAQEPAFWMNEKGHTWSHSDWKQFPKHRAKYPIPLYAHRPPPLPAPAELERLRERIARMGLDVDRAMRGHVNEQSPLGTQRLAAIAALVKPKPAPPSDDVVKDAARYRFLAGHCRSTSEHWGGRWSIVVDGPAPKSHDSEDDFDEAVDAALAAQGGKV